MKKKGARPVGGRFIVLILIVALLLFGFFVGPIRALTNDIFQGGLVNLCAVFTIMVIFFFFTLWLTSAHVLPIDVHNKHERANTRSMLFRFALGQHVAMAVIRDGAVLPGPHNESREHLSGIGVIDADSVSVVTLHSPLELSRIRGTGLIFTRENEFLKQIIDLRIQLRSQEFEYITRDGIPIKARVTLRFQIDQTTFNKHLHAHDPKDPYPAPLNWSIHTLRRALEKLQAVDSSGGVSRWSEVPILMVNGVLRAIISEYTFDGLTMPQDPAATPRADIRGQLDKRVRPILMQSGIKVLALGVGLFMPQELDTEKVFDQQNPVIDKITEQRIKAWQAEWESRINKLRGETQAEVERQREATMAQARQESIVRLAQALEQGLPPNDDLDKITQHFWKVVQKMANDPNTRALLDEDNVRMILQWARQNEVPVLPEQTESHGTPTGS